MARGGVVSGKIARRSAVDRSIREMKHHETVTVYNFRVFDAHAHSDAHGMRLAACKATRETIASRFAGEVLEGTAQDVLPSELDAQGCYRRLATGWGALG